MAVDLEMTGVASAPWRESFEFDRPDVRYLKLKDSAEKFAVVQVGVCPFRWNPAKGSFVAHPYNFYIFPRRELQSDGPTYEFLCQTTSINFLAKHQFDFNACIHEGISYLSRAQEAEALQNLSSAYEDDFSNSDLEEYLEIPIASTADLLFTERIKIRFNEWLDGILSCPGDVHPSPNSPQRQFQTFFFKMRPAVMLDGFNSHQVKLIKQQVVRKHFKDLVYVRANGENNSWQKIVVYTDSKEDKSSLLKQVKDDLHRSSKTKVHSAVGFRRVIDILAAEMKLIVGHNCLLDIAHIYSKFIGPLPSAMSDLSHSLHKCFPYIVDTKHLMNACGAIQYQMKKHSKSLSSAFSLLCPKIYSGSQNSAFCHHVKVEVETDEIGSSSWNSGAKHEAGFDAFMTGCVFAQACCHLGIKFELNSPKIDFVRNDKLQGYMNLLHPSWNSGTVINLSTGIESQESGYKRKYPTVIFSNIVLFWGFPFKLTAKKMKECISKVFGSDSVTSIFFLDSTAALIQFSKKELVNEFLTVKDTLEKNNDALSVLHPLAELLEGDNSRAANYDTYKEICSSSMSRVKFVDQAEALGIRWKTKVEPGSSETEGSSNYENMAEYHIPASAVKQKVGRRDENLHHHVTCEDILDSLSSSKSFSGQRIRIT